MFGMFFELLNECETRSCVVFTCIAVGLEVGCLSELEDQTEMCVYVGLVMDSHIGYGVKLLHVKRFKFMIWSWTLNTKCFCFDFLQETMKKNVSVTFNT